jgi:hypothetical protein
MRLFLWGAEMFNRKTEKTIDSEKNDRRFPAEYPPTSGGISGIGTEV